jgi:hypothetical protein
MLKHTRNHDRRDRGKAEGRRLALMRPVALTRLGMLAGAKIVFVCVFLSVWCLTALFARRVALSHPPPPLHPPMIGSAVFHTEM